MMSFMCCFVNIRNIFDRKNTELKSIKVGWKNYL